MSKHQNHLLKAPFSIHPKTGRVCVPFSADVVDTFDPTKVPTLSAIVDELDAFQKANAGDAAALATPGYAKTSMKGAVEQMEKGFLGPLYSNLHKAARDERDMGAAASGDW